MNSLEWRMQLGLASSLVVLMGLLWVMGNQSLRELTEDFIASRLEHDAEGLLAALELAQDLTQVRWRRTNPVYNQPFSGHYFLVRLGAGNQLTSRSLWDYRLTVPPLAPGQSRRIHSAGPADQQLLIWAKGYRKQGQDLTLAVAEDLTPIEERRDQFKRNFALLSLGGLVSLLAVQSLVVRGSFRRLNPVREDIRRLELGQTEKLSENVPTEILPLVRELNHLLRLLAQRLQRSRNALGNLAHVLKGPLNLLIQFFDADPADQDEQRRRQAQAQVERVRQLMERELKRARLAGKGIQGRHFEPQQELPDLVGVLKQIHRREPLQVDYRIEPEVPAFGDREDMLELLGNLLDNACKWANTRVRCRIGGDEEIRILVEDDGAGLSESQARRLSQRGIRLDEAVEGHGLGLAIAKDIVGLYGGQLKFGRSGELGGLQVEVHLPTDGGQKSS